VNPQDPLAALHPLREPAAIGWWPPAPGWWLLALLCAGALLALAVFLLRRHRRNAYRRRALAQLQALQARFARDGDGARYARETNALLKSVALRAYPRREVAAIHGERWTDFLNRHCSPGLRFEADFTQAVYRGECAHLDATQLHRAARHWIQHHRVST